MCLRLSLSARRAWIEIPAGCWRESRRASLSARRAWIEISGVDFSEDWLKSLSARRAWIEINMWCNAGKRLVVALRKESVDRNLIELSPWGAGGGSLSARRAWIEIFITQIKTVTGCVALRKESVDRNRNSIRRCLMSVGRSPQGERG